MPYESPSEAAERQEIHGVISRAANIARCTVWLSRKKALPPKLLQGLQELLADLREDAPEAMRGYIETLTEQVEAASVARR